MSWIADTLWDLLKPGRRDKKPPMRSTADAAPPSRRSGGIRDTYDQVVRDMKQQYGLRVRKWRKSMTGCAWEVHYASGEITRLIESPYPKGPMSCAIFLHEVGHHAIGFNVYRPRCLEEYHAWAWSLQKMRELGLNVTPSVEKRMRDSLQYAVDKARRRGLKEVPLELKHYFATN